MALVCTATIGLVGHSSTADGLAVPTGVADPFTLINFNSSKAFTSGTGANQANWFYTKSATLTGASETLDLYNSLTDRYGALLNAVKLKGIILVNKTTTSGFSLAVTGLLTETVKAGGTYVNIDPVDGLTVTPTTNDTLTINPGANTVEYDLLLWGTR